MATVDTLSDESFLLGAFFIIANQIDARLEREFVPYGITTKQWFLLIIVMTLFDSAPGIKELAKRMGSTHQNVKQIALKLEAKGLVRLLSDSQDGRVVRIQVNPSCVELMEGLRRGGEGFRKSLVVGVPEEDLGTTRRVLGTIMANLQQGKGIV